jgi:hypothetical protein
LVLLGFAVHGRLPWEAAALSAAFIAVGVELTCYYYAFIVAVALLHERDERVGQVLLLLTAFTGFVDWAPFRAMPTWIDEKYFLMSAATLVAFAVLLWRFGLGPWLGVRYQSGTETVAAPAAAAPTATGRTAGEVNRRPLDPGAHDGAAR